MSARSGVSLRIAKHLHDRRARKADPLRYVLPAKYRDKRCDDFSCHAGVVSRNPENGLGRTPSILSACLAISVARNR